MEVLFKQAIVEIGSLTAILYRNSDNKFIFYTQMNYEQMKFERVFLKITFFWTAQVI